MLKLPLGAQLFRDGEQFGIIWAGRRCSPRWNEQGAAYAYAHALAAGTRRPEYEPSGSGSIVTFPSRSRRGRT